MAYKEMTKDTDGLAGVMKMASSEEVVGVGNSPWILFPSGSKLSVVVASDGLCSVEVTNDSFSNIEADTVSANSIIEWDLGEVSSGQSVIEICSAYRLKSASGTSNMFGYATKIK